jgi:hypothetical protein
MVAHLLDCVAREKQQRIHSLWIVDIHVVVNNIKPVSIVVETQEWVPFALLSSYKIFCSAVKQYKRA